MKPWVIEWLLDRGAPSVVYLDSDVQVFAPLDELADLAGRHQLVLTPHLTEPTPSLPGLDPEAALLVSGVYNAGCLGIGRDGRAFLRWWQAHLARDCVAEPERGLFHDQSWLDLAVAYFDAFVLRDPGWNVAPWNVRTREVSERDGRYWADGRLLRFFHFGGFDPETPWLLSKWLPPAPETLLSRQPGLARLCRDYADALLARGYAGCVRLPYGFDRLPNGVAVDASMRVVYRQALIDAERTGRPEPPNPFERGAANAFVAWLREPPDPASAAARVSRYLRAVWETSPDLRAAFPDALGNDADAFLSWTSSSEGRIPAALAGPAPAPRAPASHAIEWPERLEPGVNLVRCRESRQALARVARRLVRALEQAGVSVSEIEVGCSREGSDPFAGRGADAVRHDSTLVCLGPGQIPGFAFHVPGRFFAERRSIGLWLCEDDRPEHVEESLAFLDELWVGSDELARTLAACTGKTVLAAPLPVAPPAHPPASRAELGLPDGFLFLSIVEPSGGFERQNPLAAVSAFTQAFGDAEGPTLVVRVAADDPCLPDLERLRLVAPRADVRVVDGPLGEEERAALLAAGDCYVSLHRSCELGLDVADAIASGTPVLATGGLGVLASLDEATAYLVPASPLDALPGNEAAPWPGLPVVEPDVERAAELMRRLVERPEEAAGKGRLAAARLRERHSPAAFAAFAESRLTALGRDHRSP